MILKIYTPFFVSYCVDSQLFLRLRVLEQFTIKQFFVKKHYSYFHKELYLCRK
jgi:hypothetical protein